MRRLKHFLIIIFLIASAAASAQDAKHYILILSKGEKKMVVLDYATLDTITKIPVGEDPHEIALSADHHTAYVSNAVISGTGHTINVIDLKTLEPVKDIDTKPFYVPHGMAYRNDTLWFTAQGSKCVVAYDLKQDKPVAVLGTGQDFTHLLCLTPDGNTFYTTNVESGTVSIYERKQLPPYMPPTGILPPHAKQRLEWRQSLVDVGYGAEGFDVTKDGKELWTARPDGHIIVVDLEKKAVKTSFDTHVAGLHRLKLSADEKTVYVVSVKTGELLFYNTSTGKQVQKMNVGHGAGLYLDEESNRLFVACTSDNYVAVINMATRKEIRRINIGRPDGITAVKLN